MCCVTVSKELLREEARRWVISWSFLLLVCWLLERTNGVEVAEFGLVVIWSATTDIMFFFGFFFLLSFITRAEENVFCPALFTPGFVCPLFVFVLLKRNISPP